MDKLIAAIREAEDFVLLAPASDTEIILAENQLKLSFANDYKACVKAFGAIMFGDKELTGVCKSDRLHVVPVTERARAFYPNFPADAYVIEEMLIDHIIIIQKNDGCIYSYGPADAEMKIADCLYDYLFVLDE